jgi:shikimate dehydrogenase
LRRFALIGWPIGHSFSGKYFSEKFLRDGIADARYDLLPLEHIAGLPALLSEYPDLCGLNVTIPHKKAVIPFLDELNETARETGAVNCIRIRNGILTGFNTDVTGFENSLSGFFSVPVPAGLDREALVLGTGGAAAAVAYVFRKRGIPFRFVSRTPKNGNEIDYQSLHGLRPFLIVNTTPLGTWPDVDSMPPVPESVFHQGQMVYDLVYNPAETLLLRSAKFHGAQTANGLEMLYLQAEAAWEIWNH